jgi:hypothetical protein
MSILRKLRRWCPQPQRKLPTYAVTMGPRLLAFAVLAEILVLLIAPLTYYALLAPKPTILVYGEGKEVLLTKSQITASWPNLPTGDQIEQNGGYYNIFNDSTPPPPLINCTRLNMPAFWGWPSHVPKVYDVWVQDSNGSWILVPDQYLATDNPPPMPPDGFMGTDLSTIYVIVAIITVAVSSVAGVSYLLHNRKKWKIG